MGHGIAQTTAATGAASSIIAYEAEQSFLDAGKSRIETSIEKLVSRDKLSAGDAESLMDRITFTTDLDALKDVDLVVEAIVENLEIKREFYASLGGICDARTVFASNTSSLSVASMAAASRRPDRFVGVHFFNPVQVMKLVEVIRTDDTDDGVFERTVAWVGDIGKVAVRCRDTPGFIVNRLLVPSLMQAILMLERGDASAEDIDVSMKLGAGHPMGPLHLADYVGLDTCLYIMEGWTKDFPGEPAFVVPRSLREKVERGELGRKSGKGFYCWDGDKRGDVVEDA